MTAQRKRAALEAPIEALIAPYQQKLYDDRVAMLPADVRAIIRKPEEERTAAEQKIADDYYPVLRIDTGKILEIMPAADRKRYQDLQRRLNQAGGDGGGRRPGASLPAFWTVEVDPKKVMEKSYILTSGDPERPETDQEVQPGWPFAPAKLEFREGRIEAFSDWLTAPENPMFARVAVNRLWQWHFGEGLQKTPSDFGKLGGSAVEPALARLAGLRVRRARRFSMKEMHRLIVTSDTYKLASEVDPALAKANDRGRSGQHASLALPPAPARSRADLGFDPVGGRQPRPVRRRAVVRCPARRGPSRTARPGFGPPTDRAPTVAPHTWSAATRPAATSCRTSSRPSTWTTAASPARCGPGRSPPLRPCS